ncbi:MAG: prolyl oligopeptidase family serine peptidase [Phycisphaerales bacterium]
MMKPRSHEEDPRMLPSLLLTLLLAALPALSAWTQPTAADFARAEGLPARTRNLGLNARITTVWSADDQHLWFVTEGPGDVRFVTHVDTSTGVHSNAFDAALAGQAITMFSQREVDMQGVRITGIDAAEDQGSVIVHLRTADSASFALDVLPDGTIQNVISALDSSGNLRAQPPSPRFRSGASATETSITFENRTDAPIRIYWINAQGQRQQYAHLDPGASHAQHTFATHAWLAATDAEQPLAMFIATERPAKAIITGPVAAEREEAQPRPQRRSNNLAPDEQQEMFIRDHNVFLRTVETSEERALSTTGTADDRFSGRAYWSPDSTRLIVIQTVQPQEHKVHYIESSPRGGESHGQPVLQSYDYLKPGDRITHPRPRLFDAVTGSAIPLDQSFFENPWSINNFHWAPDSSAFFFLYNQRGHQAMRLLRVDAATGEVSPIINEEPQTFFDYSNKTFLHHLDDTNEVIWMSERDGWNHLYLIDRETGAIRNQITRGNWLVRAVDRVDESSRQIWFRACGIYPDQDPYHIHHARINFDGTGLTLLTEGDGTHEIEYSPAGTFFIDTWSRADLPPVHELRSARDGSHLCELARADWSRVSAETGWQPPEPFVAPARDNITDIWGLIFRPTNFDPARKYPIIESIYAGPHGQHVPKAFRSSSPEQSLAELGFIVVKIDGMGTNWRSKAFHDYCWKNLGDAGFPDRKKWIRAAAEKYPSMDATRVGIYGGSAGGQNAMRALLDHHDLYSVAVADCGCHDNRMDKIWWNEAWMGWPVDASYERSSNVVDAAKLQGHLLLTVGEGDRNVDPASTMQVVDALIRADKDFDLIVFPGGGHGAGGSAYGRRRMEDFFIRHLYGVEPRRDAE